MTPPYLFTYDSLTDGYERFVLRHDHTSVDYRRATKIKPAVTVAVLFRLAHGVRPSRTGKNKKELKNQTKGE